MRPVERGRYDVVLACGIEKLLHEDKLRSLGACSSAADIGDPDTDVNVVKRSSLDIEEPFDATTVVTDRSINMDIYSALARKHMEKWGSTRRNFAMVTAMKVMHGSMNPR